MNKLFVAFVIALTSSVVCGLDAGVTIKLPDRDPAPRGRHWFRLTQEYQADAQLVLDILDGLNIVFPHHFHALNVRVQNQTSGLVFSALSPSAETVLGYLGFLDNRNNVRASWVDIIKRQCTELSKIYRVDPLVTLNVASLAEPYRELGCLGFFLHDDHYNPQFTAQLEALYRIVRALKIVYPKALREFLCKSRSRAYAFSEDVQPLLLRLNLLDADGNIKADLPSLVLKIVTESRDQMSNLFVSMIVEDLIARYQGHSDTVINLHLIGRNAVSPEMIHALNLQYPDLLVLSSGEMTAGARTMIHATYANILDRIRVGGIFTTIPVISKEDFFNRIDLELLDDWIAAGV